MQSTDQTVDHVNASDLWQLMRLLTLKLEEKARESWENRWRMKSIKPRRPAKPLVSRTLRFGKHDFIKVHPEDHMLLNYSN